MRWDFSLIKYITLITYYRVEGSKHVKVRMRTGKNVSRHEQSGVSTSMHEQARASTSYGHTWPGTGLFVVALCFYYWFVCFSVGCVVCAWIYIYIEWKHIPKATNAVSMQLPCICHAFVTHLPHAFASYLPRICHIFATHLLRIWYAFPTHLPCIPSLFCLSPRDSYGPLAL